MSDLTKEFLEQKLESLVTKDHFDKHLNDLDERVNTKLDALIQPLDVRHRDERLEEQVAHLKLQNR